jgi:hypothetical protein
MLQWMGGGRRRLKTVKYFSPLLPTSIDPAKNDCGINYIGCWGEKKEKEEKLERTDHLNHLFSDVSMLTFDWKIHGSFIILVCVLHR